MACSIVASLFTVPLPSNGFIFHILCHNIFQSGEETDGQRQQISFTENVTMLTFFIIWAYLIQIFLQLYLFIHYLLVECLFAYFCFLAQQLGQNQKTLST
jgi:hypothetical protein